MNSNNEGYQQVEYLESTGEQYIDTGYTPKINTFFEVTFMFDSKNPAFGTPFGEQWYGIQQHHSYNYFRLSVHKNYVYYETVSGVKYTVRYTAYTNPLTVSVDPSVTRFEYNTDSSGAIGSYSIYMFAAQLSANTPTRYFTGRIYSLKLWETNENNVVRTFIPCYRKSDKVAGMYDTVNDVFYTNAGSGSFTVGPKV